MGAGKDVDAVPDRFERGAEDGDGRALAVGPGDVEHRRQPVLRTAETVEQRRHALQPQPVSRRREHRQAVKLRLDAGIGRGGEVH
jgi:hypothetical protein